MSNHLERGRLLMEQDRYLLAEREFRAALLDDPDAIHARGYLALCLRRQKKLAEALDEARQFVGQAPHVPFAYNVLALVEFDRRRYREAEQAAQESLRLDPDQPAAFVVLATCHANQRRWKEALAAAEAGLGCEADDSDCLRLRSLALAKLGRGDEARETLTRAIAEHPEDADLWSVRGWQLLEDRQPQSALDAFREALRLEPDHEWAREGIVTALKPCYFAYRWLLTYFLWAGSLSPKAQAMLLFGQVFFVRTARGLEANVPPLRAVVNPLLVVFTLFILMTWIADPLLHLVLRLNRFGRLALDRDKIVESNWVGACAALAIVALASWPLTWNDAALAMAVVAVLLMIPIKVTFLYPSGPLRIAMGILTALLATAAIGSVTVLAFNGFPERGQPGFMISSLAMTTLIISGAIAFLFNLARRDRGVVHAVERCVGSGREQVHSERPSSNAG